MSPSATELGAKPGDILIRHNDSPSGSNFASQAFKVEEIGQGIPISEAVLSKLLRKKPKQQTYVWVREMTPWGPCELTRHCEIDLDYWSNIIRAENRTDLPPEKTPERPTK